MRGVVLADKSDGPGCLRVQSLFLLADDLLGRLVSAQPLIRRMPQRIPAGPFRKVYLCDEFGLYPDRAAARQIGTLLNGGVFCASGTSLLTSRADSARSKPVPTLPAKINSLFS